MIWLSIQQVYSLSTITGTPKKTALAFEFSYIIVFYPNLKMISVDFFELSVLIRSLKIFLTQILTQTKKGYSPKTVTL